MQLFNIAIMSVKLQVLRCNRMMDLSLVTESKLRELRDMTGSPALRDELTRIKGGISIFYRSLSAGELARVRTTLLNDCRNCNYPVGVLIADGYQSKSGHFVVPTDGPNMPNLGAATVYNEDGAVMDEYVLPIAGKSVEAVPQYVGENLFSSKRVLRRERAMSGPYGEENEVDIESKGMMSLYAADSNSGSDFGSSLPDFLPPADESDNDSLCSSASYAVRLEATRAGAFIGSPSSKAYRSPSGAGRSSNALQKFQVQSDFQYGA